MQSTIGKILTAEEVQSFKDGTKLWIETNIPSRNVFLGTKEGKAIKNLEGNKKFSVIDVGSLCVAKEWLHEESFVNRETQAIEDLIHLSEHGEIFAYQNESIEIAIKALEKQISYKLTQIDKETLTGICKCGRVTNVIDCDNWCIYCGQKVTK